ncbi:hypothetical protein CBW65_22495 [Tumebacillus avium]|uniref:Uncharacterized protein n=1 Tax=Tumebacillus avium TaxID=1903704 RepID=A0A1Y0ISM7_9BACL|nr:hypothetical protein [Tumebacillus avium]ARU63457.1 hypothetical protein CBW65_22495 [Tumebacillus avium]
MKKKLATTILAAAMLISGTTSAFAAVEAEYNGSQDLADWFDSSISGVISDANDYDWSYSYGCGHLYLDAIGLTGDVDLRIYQDKASWGYGWQHSSYTTAMDEETGTLNCGTWYFLVTGDAGADYTLSWK